MIGLNNLLKDFEEEHKYDDINTFQGQHEYKLKFNENVKKYLTINRSIKNMSVLDLEYIHNINIDGIHTPIVAISSNDGSIRTFKEQGKQF